MGSESASDSATINNNNNSNSEHKNNETDGNDGRKWNHKSRAANLVSRSAARCGA